MRKLLIGVALAGAIAAVLVTPARALQEAFSFACGGDVCLGSATAKDVYLMSNGVRRLKVDRAGLVTVSTGSGTTTAGIAGTLDVTPSAAGLCTIADTNETDTWTYTLPANTLTSTARGVRVYVYGTTAANGNTKTVKLYFGSNVFTVISGAVNNSIWYSTNVYMRTGSSAQQRMAIAGFGATQNAPTIAGLTETDTAAILLKVTLTNGTAAANDICFRGAMVEILP